MRMDGDRIKCIHVSETGDQEHRPCHFEEGTPSRVPTLGPDDQVVPDCTNKHPKINLKKSKRKSTITKTYTQYTGTR